MTPHLLGASLPLLLIAGLLTFQRLLAPLLIAIAWLVALLVRSPVAARHFRAMLGLRLSGRPSHGRLGRYGVGGHF